MEKIVVGLGEVLWDLLPQGRQLGGAPANFAYHVSRFGLSSQVVSAIGHDTLGEEIQDRFDQQGLKSALQHVAQPTGVVHVTLDANGIPAYDISTDVAWDFISFTPELEALARQTQVVCFGTLAQRSSVSRDTLYRFLESMPDTPDTWRVFDMNLRQNYYSRELLHQSLSRCNVLKLNADELVIVSRLLGLNEANPDARCRRLFSDYHLRILILTCGITGSSVYTATACSKLPTKRVRVADTVGAGDAFTAAFVAQILQGATSEEAHRLAVDFSAFVCSCPGATPDWKLENGLFVEK